MRTNDAVKTFSGNMHISLGAGASAAVGTVGRAVEADVRAGDGGQAACYTYSCSKGMYFFCYFIIFIYGNNMQCMGITCNATLLLILCLAMENPIYVQLLLVNV